MLWRSAGMPPRTSCSATARCSGARLSSTARRWVEPGLRRLGLGLGGASLAARSGRGPRSRRGPSARAGRSARGGRPLRSPSRLAPRPPLGPPPALSRSRGGRGPRSRSRGGRSRSRSRRGPAPGRLATSELVIGGGSLRSGPRTVSRSASSFFALGAVTASTVMPSSSISASAFTTSPTLAPSYSTLASSTPLGCFAPAARHVHVPSSRALVSSISILRDTGFQPTRRSRTLRPVRTAPVLLVHGFASSFERNWREPGWVDLLADAGRSVIEVDLLGHGNAAKPHEPEAYADLEAGVAGALPADGEVDAIG